MDLANGQVRVGGFLDEARSSDKPLGHGAEPDE